MENLGIDYKLLAAQLINFALFFFVFSKFIAKPFMNYLKGEQKKEEERAVLLKKLQEGESILETKEKDLLKKSKGERDEIIAQAKEDAEKVKADLIAQAHKDAENMISKAKEQIEAERQAMHKDLKEQVLTVSNLMVQKGLEDFLTEDARRQVTQNIIKHLPEKFTA
jgi:F-type H+-transporting ATPase subunit b